MSGEDTGKLVYGGTWAAAGMVFVTNGVNAYLAWQDPALGGQPLVGLGVALTVDVTLCVGLIGDRFLAINQRPSAWGRPLRVTAGVMSLVLAVAWGVVTGHYAIAVLTAFLPVLLWLVTEYGQDFLLQLGHILGDSEPSQPAVPVPAPRPVSLSRPFTVPQDWGQPAPVWASQGHTGNGHRDTGPGLFSPPSHPDPDPVPVPDVPAGTVPTQGPVPDLVPSPGAAEARDVPGDGTPSVDEVRQWRTRRARRGLPVGHRYLRQRWPSLTEREARSLITQLKQPAGVTR